jgi:hypothetical protein
MFEVSDLRSAEEKQRDINIFKSVDRTQQVWGKLSFGSVPQKEQIFMMNPSDLCFAAKSFSAYFMDVESDEKFRFFEHVADRALQRIRDFEVDQIIELLESFGKSAIAYEEFYKEFAEILLEEVVDLTSNAEDLIAVLDVLYLCGMADQNLIKRVEEARRRIQSSNPMDQIIDRNLLDLLEEIRNKV